MAQAYTNVKAFWTTSDTGVKSINSRFEQLITYILLNNFVIFLCRYFRHFDKIFKTAKNVKKIFIKNQALYGYLLNIFKK